MSILYNRSCLRWPGNKYSLLKEIIPRYPKSYNNYHEPFLGSATVFLNIAKSNEAYLSDNCEDLINFYIQIRDNLEDFIKIIERKVNSETFYYTERDMVYCTELDKAAQFYYLNRTCFNGIYRVNSLGKFNVPFGFRENLNLVDKNSLNNLSSKLKNAEISHCDFNNTLDNINVNDFVFLDPPYSAKKQSNKFNMYNEKLFSWEDQIRLKKYCETLIGLGAKFMLTNLYNEDIYQLFAKELSLKCIKLERYSGVSSQAKNRGMYNEYVFFNYSP